MLRLSVDHVLGSDGPALACLVYVSEGVLWGDMGGINIILGLSPNGIT